MLGVARGRRLLDASIAVDAGVAALNAKVLARVPLAEVLAATKVLVRILAAFAELLLSLDVSVAVLDAKVAARVLAIRYRMSTKVF